MSLETLVQHHLPGRLRPSADSAARESTAVSTALVEPVAAALPDGSMRVLEALVALAAIVTAVLIGVR